MADPRKNPNDNPSSNDPDETFRAQMRTSQEPEALAWTELDDTAQKQSQDLEERDQQHRQLKTPMVEAYDALSQARRERDQWRQDNERTSTNAEQWDQDYQKLDQTAADRQQDFQGVMKNASLEEVDAMRQDIDRRRDELATTIAERQGIALLPSERVAQANSQQQGDESGQGQGAEQDDQASEQRRQEEGAQRERMQSEDDDRARRQQEEDRLEQGQADQPQQQDNADELTVEIPALEEWRARQSVDEQQEDGQQSQQADQGMGQGPGGFHWRAYATSAEEAQADRQLEQDQTELAYQLGRAASSDEIDSYQAARAQTQAQGATGESDDAHESVTEGLRTGQERSNVNEQGQGAPEQDEKQSQGQGGEVVIPELAAARQNRQTKQEQGQGGAEPQPNSTYAQRQAAQAQQAQKVEQADQAGQTETAQDGMVRRRSQTSSQGMGL